MGQGLAGAGERGEEREAAARGMGLALAIGASVW